jgi:uncharacterized protein YgiM (DUF1202 family)
MKKSVLILAFLVQTLVAAAAPNPNGTLRRVSAENVKMYIQAGTSTQVLRSLTSTDEVMVIRPHNNYWSIVSVEGQVGYVLTSELIKPQGMKNKVPMKSDRIR